MMAESLQIIDQNEDNPNDPEVWSVLYPKKYRSKTHGSGFNIVEGNAITIQYNTPLKEA